jgi:conjugal transfer pilus assembly protein TraW
MRASCVASITAGLLASGTAAGALDLGQIGPTYPVAEPHLLEVIQQRLRAKERSGELQRQSEAAASRARVAVLNPDPVAAIAVTQVARTFFVDPTYQLDRNILDGQGRLLFPAGTRKNPLEVVSLGTALLFFDARDARQMQRARLLLESRQGRVKPILVGGSYLELMKAWRLRVYYDQQGLLTRRLGITHVPALVTQQGLQLRVDELVP